MDIAVDRRRFLIAGSAALTAVAAGSTYLWWGAMDATPPPAGDAIRVVPGADRTPIVLPSPAPPQATLSDTSAAPDRDAEARLNRLMEDDTANSQQRMRERQERRSNALQPIAAITGDAAPTTWAP